MKKKEISTLCFMCPFSIKRKKFSSISRENTNFHEIVDFSLILASMNSRKIYTIHKFSQCGHKS